MSEIKEVSHMERRSAFCINCHRETACMPRKVKINQSVRDKSYTFEITTFVCSECGREIGFPGLMDYNIKEMDEQYRKAEEIITVEDIERLMKLYSIGKAPLSLALGFGEVTITRYLAGQVPSKEYSDIMLHALASASYMKELLDQNREKIGETAYKKAYTAATQLENLYVAVPVELLAVIAYIFSALHEVTPLTTKLFCGKCGTLMGGESGTSHMGNTYYYYKCGNAKRHGKAHCDLKAIRKEPLERFVVDTAIKVIFSDEIIERLIDLVMEAQQQENTRLPVLKEQLRDTEKRLANLLEAIEQGILTPTTKQRLDELEARKEALNTSILEEELKKPVLTREWMRFWFEKFRKGDVGSTEHQRQIIDTFVNSVYVFDDRVVLNFNFTDDAKTVTREEVLGSSAVDNAPPKQEPLT